MKSSFMVANRQLMIRLAYAFGFFIVATLLFGILADKVTESATASLDTSALLWINSHTSAGLDVFFVTITDLGGAIAVASISLALVIYYIVKKRYHRAVFVAAAVGGAALLNLLLKLVFERERPDLWEVLITETSFSFPSGHAMASSALALTIVALAWKTKWRYAIVFAACLYGLLIGFSRLYLGVHFPTDIIGGWIVSAAWVAVVTAIMYTYVFRKYHPSQSADKAHL